MEGTLCKTRMLRLKYQRFNPRYSSAAAATASSSSLWRKLVSKRGDGFADGRRLFAHSSHNISERNSARSVRQTFIDFFKDKGYRFVPSSSVIPRKDEGTYFVNAGMNQFKPVFLGISPPPHPFVVNSQKCIRVGGKHNDLSEVGFDTYHHTFFEMLGTWSFTELNKEFACASAWELLTQVYGFATDRLYVTVFGGDANLGLTPDYETWDIWQKIGVKPNNILWGSAKDNFWEMGESGPCGASTEIHYDVIGGRDASKGVNVDGSNVIEIWNLVFIEHVRESSSALRPLAHRHLDTGLGFERLVAAVQGKTSNYDSDLFSSVFQQIHRVTKANRYSGRFGNDDEARVDAAYRIIADHLRMATVAIADGLIPSNKGLGAKLRHVIERASNEMHVTLKTPPGSLNSLILPVVESLSSAYPEVSQKESLIREIVDSCESHFFAHKIQARENFQTAFNSLTINDGVIAGGSAWYLCDSKNISLDILQELAAEKNLVVDVAGFEGELVRHKARSIPPSRMNKSLRPAEIVGILKRRKPDLKKTLDVFKYDYRVLGAYCVFPGIEAQLVAIVADGDVKDIIGTDAENDSSSFVAVFNGTNFYAEAGGQKADKGRVSCRDEKSEMKVTDVQVEEGYVLHYGEMIKGHFQVGDICSLSVDAERRMKLMSNHSATHLLNSALGQLLDSTTMQMGSKVDEENFTFDFYTTKPVDSKLIRSVEESVNIVIAHNVPVFRGFLPAIEAKQLEDLITLESETYPDSVSVISVGMPIKSIARKEQRQSRRLKPVSLELCCGTHVLNTGAIERFVITNVNSVGHNIKRITAVTRDGAKEALKNVPLVTSHVETFENEMLEIRDRLLERNVDAECASSSSSSSSSSISISPLTNASYAPSNTAAPHSPYAFEEIVAKLNSLKTNFRENPLPVGDRLHLEERLSKFGAEMATLKHIDDLRRKDLLAAEIYAQLAAASDVGSRKEGEEVENVLGKFVVRELKLNLKDSGTKSVSKALMRAPRQLQNLNEDKRLTGMFIFKTDNKVFSLGYVPDEKQAKLSAYEWVLYALSSVGSHKPKGTALKNKLSEHLMYFGWIESVDSVDETMDQISHRASEYANERL